MTKKNRRFYFPEHERMSPEKGSTQKGNIIFPTHQFSKGDVRFLKKHVFFVWGITGGFSAWV